MKENGWPDKPYGIRNNFNFNFYTLYLLVASYLYLYIWETIENLFGNQDRADNPLAEADNHDLQLVLFDHQLPLIEENPGGGALVARENSNTNNDVLFGGLDNGNVDLLAILTGDQANIRAIVFNPGFIVVQNIYDQIPHTPVNPEISLLLHYLEMINRYENARVSEQVVVYDPNIQADNAQAFVGQENINGEGRAPAGTLAELFENDPEGALAFIVHVLDAIEEEKEGDSEDVITTEVEVNNPEAVIGNPPLLLLTNGNTTFNEAIGSSSTPEPEL